MKIMQIFKGSQELTEFFQGCTEIAEIYYGTTAVWKKIVEEVKEISSVFSMSDLSPKVSTFVDSLSSSSQIPTPITMSVSMPQINITDIPLATLDTSVDVSSQIPLPVVFSEAFTQVGVNDIHLKNVTENVTIDIVLEQYVIEPAKASDYEYNTEYVATDNAFELQTEYTYTSNQHIVDSGRMCSVLIKTDDKENIESVVINSELQ